MQFCKTRTTFCKSRELSHAIERALILGDGESLDAESFSLVRQAGTQKAGSLDLEASERNMVRLAIEQSGGNISHAAGTLGITRAALYRRIEKFDL